MMKMIFSFAVFALLISSLGSDPKGKSQVDGLSEAPAAQRVVAAISIGINARAWSGQSMLCIGNFRTHDFSQTVYYCVVCTGR